MWTTPYTSTDLNVYNSKYLHVQCAPIMTRYSRWIFERHNIGALYNYMRTAHSVCSFVFCYYFHYLITSQSVAVSHSTAINLILLIYIDIHTQICLYIYILYLKHRENGLRFSAQLFEIAVYVIVEWISLSVNVSAVDFLVLFCCGSLYRCICIDRNVYT